jgi:hypothetical protein
MRAIALLLTLATSTWVWSEPLAEIISTGANARSTTQASACALAFEQAEADAIDQLTDVDTSRPELLSRIDERLGEADDELFDCRVETRWSVRQTVIPSEPTPEVDTPDLLRLGALESIDGRYQAECRATNRGEACRAKIEAEAGQDLLARLFDRENLTDADLALEADGFEGSQSFNYDRSDLTLTMDGTFYFIRTLPRADAIEAAQPKAVGTQGALKRTSKPEPDPQPLDNLDVTLFYVWDGNDRASSDHLALSARRWGIGLWVDNRIGVSAFLGDERAGIADNKGNVYNDGDRYSIRGVGVGYRWFDNRPITLESVLHFVDAQPYSALLAPDCSGCTPSTYEADNYVQATLNLKTNNEGLNLGWMLTWKVRENMTQYDNLSGGWYVEVQF